LLEHQPTETKSLEQVKAGIVVAIQAQKAKDNAQTNAETIKQQLLSGVAFNTAVKEQKLKVKTLSDLARNNSDLDWQVNQAVFKAAKPSSKDDATIIVVASAEGEQTIVKLLSVTEGSVSGDAEKEKLAKMNISNALGKADYAAIIDGIRVNTVVSVKQ